MKKNNKVTILVPSIFILCLIALFIIPKWHLKNSDTKSSTIVKAAQNSSAKVITPPVPSSHVNPPPAIKYPIEASSPKLFDAEINSEPVPKIEDSDLKFQHWANKFFGKLDIQNIFIFDNFINRFVVFTINASNRIIPSNMYPVKAASGKLIVKTSGSEIELSEENSKRYNHYVDLVKSADLNKVALFYKKMYPLFQSSYRQLGEEGYFNDRVVEVIDVALATPDIKGPIKLFYSNSQYEFVDSKLESLSAVQKIFIRIGSNASRITKSRLKELRKLITGIDH